MALAIGAPMAVAATRPPLGGAVIAADPTATPTVTASPAPTDTASPSASASASASASPSPSASASATPSPSPDASATVLTADPPSQTVLGVAYEAITPTAPITSADLVEPLTYRIVPDLPAGLTMSRTTGSITGTPQLAQKPRTYTITADDGTNSAEATVTISVDPRVLPASVSLELKTEVPMTPSRPLADLGFTGTVSYSVLPELPKDLVLDPVIGRITGTPVAAQAKTSYEISATDGTFTVIVPLDITVTCFDTLATGLECTPPTLAQGGDNPNTPLALLAAYTPDPIHGPYTSMQTDTCAACHRTHSGKQVNLLTTANPRSQLCFSCHNGTGAAPNTWTEYYSGTYGNGTQRYTNNAATRTYYMHNSLETTNHSGFVVDDEATSTPSTEFKGTLNRHAECTDCHNPHNASVATSTPTATGWTASGDLKGATGVAVTNGAANTAPTYTLLGGYNNPVTREYQVCFKCHSSYTTLPSNTGFGQSKWFLDAGAEFNPANASFHPVEAAGKNATPKMTLSLSSANVSGAGGTPTKRWSFAVTDTVRCTHCHASGTTTPVPGTTIPNAPHVSANAGILLANYRTTLRPSGNSYSVNDFALCYTCHTNQPFDVDSSASTNFRYHYKHVKALGSSSSSTGNIDTPGSGSGDALCAECHFRLHSTTFAPAGQTIDGTRLVNFAPNVQASGGVVKWTRGGTIGTGTCTLICHGQNHSNWSY